MVSAWVSPNCLFVCVVSELRFNKEFRKGNCQDWPTKESVSSKKSLPWSLICNAKTWSQKKKKEKEKEMHEVCYVFQPLDCLSRLNWEWTLFRRIWVTKSWLTKESDCHQKNLILNLNLWCKESVPQEKKKGNIVNCFGHWTVFICWTESGLCKRDGWLRADPQRSQIVTQLISPSVLI